MVIIVNSEKNKKSQKHGAVSLIKTFRCSKKLNLKKAAIAPQRTSPQKISRCTIYDFLRSPMSINYFLIKEPLKVSQNEILIPEF
jgi:hypothetical protein